MYIFHSPTTIIKCHCYLSIISISHHYVEKFRCQIISKPAFSRMRIHKGKNADSSTTRRRFAFATPTTFQNKLINLYVKCERLVDARKVLEHMKEGDSVSWNSIIAAYQRNGCPREALALFQQMQRTGLQPDQFTFASVLPACAKMGALEQGMGIHQSIKNRGMSSDVVVATSLVDMYAKCGSMNKARNVFVKMRRRNVVSWNAMIAGYAQNVFFVKALETFKQMLLAGVKPDPTTFVIILPACAQMGALEQGIAIHQIVIESGLFSVMIVGNALADMYGKCGSIDNARELFDKMPQRGVVSWTAMIAGYAQNGFVERALETFKQMQLSGVKPNSTTFSSILPVCAKVGVLEQGMNIHRSITEGGFWSDVIVATALVDMYAKCGRIDKAYALFARITQRDVMSWNAMIAGYAQNGFLNKALETFKQLRLAGVEPNSTTFASILPACAKMGALDQGMDIHLSITEGGFLSDVVVATALVDMYAKCGNLDKAREVFDRIPQKDVMSWNAMIAGYAQNGFSKDAVEILELMKESGTYPDTVSFACVLLACSHAGLVDEACTYFNQMTNSCCITPTVDHYVCMVDLLARAGHLEDTLNYIIKMPVKLVVVVWMCFLSACRSHMNLGLGVFTANLLLDLDPKDAATYVLLSNIYAEVGRWGEAQMVRRLMKERRIKKIPGCSWIQRNKMVHVFRVGDSSHTQTQEIYSKPQEIELVDEGIRIILEEEEK